MLPKSKSASLTRVSKAVVVPKHLLHDRLCKMLEAVDGIHRPLNLKRVSVIMDRRVMGGLFHTYADTGPYSIYLNPNGNHLELSLLHEVGHFLEWQCIPKDQHGPRNFATDLRFTAWLQAIYETQTVQRLLALLKEQGEDTQEFGDVSYLLRPNELWTRAYSRYVASKTIVGVVSQQISAENKVVTGTIKYQPYWIEKDFSPVQEVMDMMFAELGWTK